MSILGNQPLNGVRSRAGRALAWWLGELRALQIDAARYLRDLAGNTVTITAGERRWIVRRGLHPIGEIDWDAEDAPSSRQTLRELTAPAGPSAAILIEIP